MVREISGLVIPIPNKYIIQRDAGLDKFVIPLVHIPVIN